MNGALTVQLQRRRQLTGEAYAGTGVYRIAATGLAAGLAGGLAEIGWIGLYDLAGGVSSRAVAGEIARTLGLGGSTWMPAAATGVLIHMLAAVVLGIVLAAALHLPRTRIAIPAVEVMVVVSFLALIWGFNFHLLGPDVAPGFVALLPDSVSLVSKLLFGLSAAAVLLSKRWLATPAVKRSASC